MRRLLIVLFFFIVFTGVASAGTYTVRWVNVKTVNDTINLNFVSTVSNATLTISNILDNSGDGIWKRIDVFPFTATTTANAQYCIKIKGNWINVTNSTGVLKTSLYDPLFWVYVNTTGADIRFTNKSSELYFWIQNFNSTTKTATIWVNIPAGSNILKMYYGNNLALPSYYDKGSKTFNFFDNFNEVKLDSIKWPYERGTFGVSNGYLILTTDSGTAPGDWLRSNYYGSRYVAYMKVIEENDVGFLIHAQGNATQYSAASGINEIVGRLWLDEWDGTEWSGAGTYVYSSLIQNGETYILKEIVNENHTKLIVTNLDLSVSRNLTYSSGYFGIHYSVGALSKVDWVFVASLSDPVTFGTPIVTNNTINVTIGIYSAQVSSSSIAIPSTAFSNVTVVKINSPIAINAILTFDYAYSATTTITDIGTVIEKSFSINTTGLSVPVRLNVTFPLRTKSYKLFVNVSPTTTVTNTTTNTSVITSYILQNNTTYTIDEKIGYLIASFTGKDELTGVTLSSITVNYTSSTGWKSVSGPTVSIYGTDLPLHQIETVIEFSSAGYSNRHYILDCTKLNQSIMLYLLADSSSTMITYTVVSGTTTLPNAKVEIYKYIGDEWALIDSQYTDASGVVAVPLHAFDTYKIVASKQGYDTVTATITITQSTYTIKLGGVSLAIPASHRAVIIFNPAKSTLQPGNNTISVNVVPQGTTVTTATMIIYVNDAPVATVTKTDITSPTTLSATVKLNQSSSVSVKVSYIENKQVITISKNYTVPVMSGMWAALLLMNQQLIQTPNGKSIGMLIAAFIALAVVASLAATTNTTARGLGLVGLIIFTIIALPLNAISLNILIIVWVAAIASWVVWRWI